MMPTANEDANLHKTINFIKRSLVRDYNSRMSSKITSKHMEFINRFIECSFQFIIFKKEEVKLILEVEEIDIYDSDDDDAVGNFQDTYCQALDDECIERFYFDITNEDMPIMIQLYYSLNYRDGEDNEDDKTYNKLIRMILIQILSSTFIFGIHFGEKYFYIEPTNILK